MRWLTRLTAVLLSVVLVLIISGCGGSLSPHITQPPPHLSTWTWISGANTSGQIGAYGTQGTASSSNLPGSRYSAVSWTDNGGDLWLFGGFGNDSTATLSLLNDLWKFDGTNWIWMGGSQIGNGVGSYGTLGTASASNLASSRGGAVPWIDVSGNLWLFGGLGKDPTDPNSSGNLNDLWRFTP